MFLRISVTMAKNTAKHGGRCGVKSVAADEMVAMSLKMPAEDLAALKELARSEDRTVSSLLRVIVRRGLTAGLQPVCCREEVRS